MKKAVSILFCTVMLIVSFAAINTVTVWADKSAISVSTEEPKVGQNLIVALKYNAPSGIKDIEATLSFNSSALEYISGGESVEGSEISIRETKINKNSHSIYITFKGKKEGKSNLSAKITATTGDGSNTEEVSTSVTVFAKNSNDYLVRVGDKKYHIVDDLTDIDIPSPFAPSTTEYNEMEINTITDGKKYTLFYLTATDESVSDWFYIDEKIGFTRLDYITCNNSIYIIESPKDVSRQSKAWFLDKMDFDGRTFKAYKSTDLRLKDIYILYCYKDGKNNYYRYDTIEDTIQRAPDFITAETTKKTEETDKNFIESFAYLPNSGKVIFALSVIETLSLILLAVILIRNYIVKIKNRAKTEEQDGNQEQF